MSDAVKVGVIGVGNLGQHHARCYRQLQEAELVGVADVDRERGEAVADKNRCRYFSDYREMLPLVEAVSIVVPTTLHHRVGLASIEAGCHVLVEKPMAKNVPQAEALIGAARRRKRVLQVGHIERFNPLVTAISGVPGPLKYITTERLAPFRKVGLDVGVVLDLMIHDIDLVLNLVGAPVRKVDVIGVPVFTSCEDIANVRLEFAGGCVANLSASRISRKKSRKIRLFRGDSYVSADLISGKMRVWRREIKENGSMKIRRLKPVVEKKEPLLAELESFLSCVRRGGRPVVDGGAGRDALALAIKVVGKIKQRLKSS